MISVSNMTKYYGHQTLFEGVTMQFLEGNRYGLVGANGSGKSTFLKILSGDEEPSSGSYTIPKRLTVGVLKQDHFEFENISILNVVLMGNKELWTAMKERDELLAASQENFDGERYAELEDIVLRNDGYSMEAKAGEILDGLGIPPETHGNNLSTLSGGFKLRVLLAQVLAANPDVLFLDEPTNHLDILSIRWLEIFLSEFKGTVLVVSHDHRFLDNVCTHTTDVDYATITNYVGNYSAFVIRKQEDRDQKEKEITKREKEIADHKAFVIRFKAKATKARQAQSKMKQIEKIKIPKLAQSSRRYPNFKLKQIRPSGKKALVAEEISKSYGDNQVLNNVSLTLMRGDRLAIIGPNGIGKSTLLKILVERLDQDSGTVEWGHETKPGYFAQDHEEIFSDSNKTVEDWLWDFCPGQPIGFVRGNLGMVLFSGDEVEKKVPALSGGEAARLMLAKMSVDQPNLLVLDEPTNHLDMEAIEALVKSLKAYDGTLVFVSHDRWFVSHLATRILEITPTGINDFPGPYQEYLQRLGDDHLDADTVILKAKKEKKASKKAKDGKPQGPKVNPQKIKNLKKDRDKVAKQIEEKESRIFAINEMFADSGFFYEQSQDKISALDKEQQGLKQEVDDLMAKWESLEKQVEAEA